ncbi:UNVERIFIED_CONTAM: hypothetical protein PYX00_000025 [Menopon gallinae]|uniref:Alpha-1,4-N-acetylglucosaminyltransferase n=2 Tax=Menopon gallinae TaxID=328185 RepID=A0AAW2I8W6_9NEOP
MMNLLKKYAWHISIIGQKRISLHLKIFLAVVACTACLVTLIWYNTLRRNRGNIGCFFRDGNVLAELRPQEPLIGAPIFFHETSCHGSEDIYFKQRQACSVESALLAHPEKNVFLLISRPVTIPLHQTRNVLIRELMTYPNFRVRHISFTKYLSGTPLVDLGESGLLSSESSYPVAHASDILRYATLYKFDGIYLDLDVLVLKPLGKLNNFAGAESDSSIGSGILGFGGDAVGREIARDCVEELRRYACPYAGDKNICIFGLFDPSERKVYPNGDKRINIGSRHYR